MCAVIVLVVTDRAAMATNSSGTSSSSANPAGIASAGAYSTGTSIHLLNCVVTLILCCLSECISVLVLSLTCLLLLLVGCDRERQRER